MRGASKDGELVSIMVDIERDAMHALKERYGRNVPEINESGLSYKKIGFVWKHHIVDRNHDWVTAVENTHHQHWTKAA